MNEISRGVVTVAGRALHFRRLGKGPPVVLLHESPRSSAVLMPLARALEERFTVLALDTPGYGLSDPLPLARPETTDFADAIVASLRGLKLGGGAGRVPVYGTHTGAALAVDMAARHPDLVSGAVLDGYPMFSRAEKDRHAALYLPPFDPAWDGGTVARLWSRIRDQYTFFPWYVQGEETRLRRDPPPPAQQNAVIRDVLMAGPHYATAYAAAFRYDADAGLAGVRAPLHFATREDDLLFSHLDRLPQRDGLTVERLGTDRRVWGERIGAALERLSEAATAPPAPTTLAWAPRGALGVDLGDLVLRVYGTGSREAAPLLLLHDSPGGAWEWSAVASREAERRQVLVPELPGHGHSPAMPAEADALRGAVDRLLALMDRQGAERFDIAGRGIGAVVAHRLARQAPSRVGRLVVVDPALPRGAAISDMVPFREPDWHGSHLLSAWYEARDRLLYRPWCDRRAERARVFGPGLDMGEVQGRFTSIVLADNEYLPLAHAAMEEAENLLSDGHVEMRAVLVAGDPDGADLAEAFRRSRTEVVETVYDALADRVVATLRAP